MEKLLLSLVSILASVRVRWKPGQKKCPFCGKYTYSDEEAKFCIWCGKQLPKGFSK